jgi:regulator of cell morphogenesis and NO signaling
MNKIKTKNTDDTTKIIGFVPEQGTNNSNTKLIFDQIAEDLKRPSLFNAENYSSFELKAVLSYLRMSHEFYLSKKIPEIEQQLVHIYNKFPEYKLFRLLYLFFKDYKSHLVEHIEQEESTVLKYVNYLVNKPSSCSIVERMLILQGSPSLNHFLDSHNDTEQDLSAMRKVLRSEEKYKQLHPISMLLNQLAALENHLNIHARIEDEVFVPKALELEKELIG